MCEQRPAVHGCTNVFACFCDEKPLQALSGPIAARQDAAEVDARNSPVCSGEWAALRHNSPHAACGCDHTVGIQ